LRGANRRLDRTRRGLFDAVRRDIRRRREVNAGRRDRGVKDMLTVVVLIYFLPTIVALSRGHLSALAIFFLDLFLGWTLIGWLAALIWSCTGNTSANFYRLNAAGPTGAAPPRRTSGPLWLALILILIAIAVFDNRRDYRDLRSFDFSFPPHSGVRL